MAARKRNVTDIARKVFHVAYYFYFIGRHLSFLVNGRT